MARTRTAVLLGARASLLKQGSRTTMVDIALTSGVAKATLYNHFRTKPEVFAALVEHEVATLAAETAELLETAGPTAAFSRLAERLGEHPVVRRLAASEPGVLAGLLLPEQAGLGAPSWETARTALDGLLGGRGVEIMLRFLVSQLLWPTPRAELGPAVAALLALPGPRPEAGPEVGPGPEPAGVPGGTVAGLGFPRAAEQLGHVGTG